MKLSWRRYQALHLAYLHTVDLAACLLAMATLGLLAWVSTL